MQQRLPDKGFSILELMVVLVIVFGVVTLSMIVIDSSKSDLSMQNVAKELKAGFETARSDSMKRRPTAVAEMAKVTIDSADSFSISTDANYDGALSTTETRKVDLSYQSAVRIFNKDLNFPVTVVFDKRGRATALDKSGNNINAVFTICDDGCDQKAPKPQDSRIISVSPAGTVALLFGGESPVTAATPALVSVSTSSNIKSAASTSSGGDTSLLEFLFGGLGN
ncbi:MAG: GspH/FimT family protein [Pyrinomonadaceae bacterium]